MYHYVGPQNLAQLAYTVDVQTYITSEQDLVKWANSFANNREITATFIIDTTQHLFVAERGIEHVVCAKGKPLLSAGELTLILRNGQVEISEITNQSTGYCPEPESWEAVVKTLGALEIKFPSYWTNSFIFRRCLGCGSTNIVKENWYFCAICNTELPLKWNFGDI